MADWLLVDVRRFAMAPGRPLGEPFERLPRRALVAPLVRWVRRRWGAAGPAEDPIAVPAYIADWERRTRRF